ncbi:hypothetical protein AG1IA_01259 [Rhizoctonia solani AG-1 IA]|uniref:Uncharacterized protein n=1 Tax=Thanatephorus cucumeris (strain AG1-IA) TaxID=983506 RepID=L8X6P5_THACA|nr:hypothetical protein AG1IA_01259 [Rhizoctonia solani AG-1 IA]
MLYSYARSGVVVVLSLHYPRDSTVSLVSTTLTVCSNQHESVPASEHLKPNSLTIRRVFSNRIKPHTFPLSQIHQSCKRHPATTRYGSTYTARFVWYFSSLQTTPTPFRISPSGSRSAAMSSSSCFKVADQSCASCGTKNPSIVPLQRNMSPPVSEWFRPLSDAHESLVMASRIQHNMFVALIRHYRQRYDAAKIMIRQLQTELESLRSQLYLAASPRLGILEQRDLYDNLYSSSSGSASKRRRIDVEGAVSSPHSSSTPNRPTRAFNDNSNITAGYESSGLTQTIEHRSHSLNHRLNPTSSRSETRTLDAKKYAFIPPSTPVRGQPTGNAGGQCIPQTPGAQPMSRPQSTAVMPPPTLDPRRMTTRAASASLSRGNIQGSTNVGPSMNTHVGRFGGQPHAVQRRSELELVGKEGGGTPRTFGVRDGRRFIPGMPVGSKSRFAAG